MPVTPEEMAEREKEDAIRIFALKNYTDISKEVHSAEENRQEYLTALSGMSHLSVYHIKKIHSDSESESDFADNILKAYQEKMNYN